jgi:hypothetical protein
MIYEDTSSPYEKAANELKRIDHLIYVSLKYTRTVDVIKNIVDRMLNAFDIVFDELLTKAEKAGQIFEIPAAPKLKCNMIKKLYKDEAELKDYIEFYLLLRKFKNAQYTANQEFRRYVTMTATFASGEVKKLDIDIITEYYHKMKDFVGYSKTLLEPVEEKSEK